jgi:hypothetical protein
VRRTVESSRARDRSRARLLELVAYAVVATGCVLIVLGVLEVGGLFALAVGFAVVSIGGVVLLLAGEGRRVAEEEELFRRLEDG